MALRIEWRTRAEGDDTIIAVEESSNEVVKTWPAETDVLTDFLNDMVDLHSSATMKSEGKSTNGVDPTHRPPQDWGELVMARSEEGDVLRVEPGLYWERIAYWFRSRGLDPHIARRS